MAACGACAWPHEVWPAAGCVHCGYGEPAPEPGDGSDAPLPDSDVEAPVEAPAGTARPARTRTGRRGKGTAAGA